MSLMLTLAFAGCAGDAHEHEEGEHDQHEGDGEALDHRNETVDAPAASIVVSIDGNETFAENGSIPAVVGANVTLDGSASSGSNLSFAWDFGDGATGTNATEVHAFADAGAYNVTLTVTSGNLSASASVALNVSAGGPAAGELVFVDSKSFSGSLVLGNPNSAMNAGVDYNDHAITIVDASPDGVPVVAKKAKIVLDGGGAGGLDFSLIWRGPTGTQLASAATTATADETIIYEGDMPPGNYVVRVRLFAGGGQATYAVKAEISYLAA